MNIFKKEIQLRDGRVIEIETGKLAKQADGAVVVKMGNTMLLATVVAAKEAKEGSDFMPLSVEYKEKYAAAGRYPGGFLKREGRANDSEILVSRLIDRALRPLFPENYHAEVFVNVNLISADKSIMPDAMAGLAASAALAVSDIPFGGPISEVRVARIEGQFVINPTFEELTRSDIDIMVAGTLSDILMVEGEFKEISEAEMLEAVKFGHEEIKIQCQAQVELSEMVGKTTKREYSHESDDEALHKAVEEYCYQRCYTIAKNPSSKQERSEAFAALKAEFEATLSEEDLAEKQIMVNRYYHAVEKKAMRNLILDEGVRLDGRATDKVRPIWSEIDYLPATHGSALFTRGETQSLTTVTLGTRLDMKEVDEVLVEGSLPLVLHYNFPPYSTGDARPYRGVGRREIGHGNLALRAIKNMVPNGEENPYSVRIVSDILESNGSSSMATVCAATLSLMDAGIQIKKPVSGIAMGLIADVESGRHAILSDILGDEDHLGDMDFKVAGTKDGITATQMDIKVDGLSYKVLEQALEQARVGRLHILDEMMKTIDKPRAELKPHTPRIVSIVIPGEFIGAVIGSGGKVIQEIQKSTGTTVTITEENESGIVEIFGQNQEDMERAYNWIKGIATVPEEGTIYNGKISSIVEFGAFVEILPGKEGLLHISEMDWKRVANVESLFKVGDEVEVKLLEVDAKTGKMRLSRRALLEKPEGYVEPERRAAPPRRHSSSFRDKRRN
ncbi:MAG: polyribonucleotide nucleotidyltransferase [Bacteroidales bacterium]